MRSKLKSINEVLESIEKLDIDGQEYVSEVLSKRLIEIKRSRIAMRSKEAEQAYKDGRVKEGSFKDLWK